MSFSAIRSRIGLPQLIALLLLIFFALQCVWFIAHRPLTALEGVYVEAGLLHLEGLASAGSAQYSPLVPLLAGVPARLSGAEKHLTELERLPLCRMRLPFVVVGLLLAASLWYVARRLYGNFGGYIALCNPVLLFLPLTVWVTRARLVPRSSERGAASD